MKPTLNQMIAMRYGVVSIGSYIHFKIRLTAELADVLMLNSLMKSFKPDLTIIYNKARTHAHIAGVFHSSTNFPTIFTEAKKRSLAFIEIGKKQQTLFNV